MTTERIDIVVAENGSRTVKRNLDEIGAAGARAGGMVGILQKSLIGLGVGAAFLKAARDVSAFADAMAEVSTLVDTTQVSMSRLNATVLEQAGLYGSMPVEQAKALYQIISAGASDAATANEQLDASNKLAIGGVTDVATAADGLTSALNAYGTAIASATDASDAMFVAVKAGKTTIGELSTSMGVVAPLAAAAGVSFDELLASAAALTKGGVTTNVAMTGLRATMAAVLKPSSEASKMAEQLGIDFSAAALETKGLAGFMNELKEKTQGNPEVLAQLFGGVEALVPVMALMGKGGEDMNAILEDMAEKGGATQEAFDKMANSPGFQVKRVFASLTAEVIKLGQPLVQMLVPALRALADHMDAIFIIGKGLALAFAWRLAASAAVTGLIGPFIALRTAFGTTAAMSAVFSVSMDTARAAVTRLTVAMLANPFTALLVGVTLAIAAIVSFGDQVSVTEDGAVSLKDAFFGALSLIGDLVRVVAGVFLASWDFTIGSVTEFLASFGVSWSDVFSAIWAVTKGIINAVIGVFVYAWNTIKVAWGNFPGYIDVIFTAVLNLAAEAAQAVLNAWQVPLKFISQGLSYVSDDAAAALSGFLDSTRITIPKAKLSAAGRQAAGDIIDGARSAFTTDYLGNFGNAAIARARTLNGAKTPAEAAADAVNPTGGGSLPGMGTGGDSAADKAAQAAKEASETRAGYLAKIRTEAEGAIRQAGIFDAEMRKVDEALTSVNATLLEKGWEVLSPAEETDLKQLVKLREEENRIMQVRDGILDAARGPSRAYEDHLVAAKQLLDANLISLGDYTQGLRDARIAYLQTQQDMASGLELGRLTVGRESDEVGARVASAYQSEWRNANGAMQELQDRVVVLQQLMQDDPINSGQYALALRQAGLEALQLKASLPDATFMDGIRAGFAGFVQDFVGIIPSLNAAWGQFFTQFANGFANSVGRAIVDGENLGQALRDVAKSALTELIGALVKMGIQWLVMQLIGQSAMGAISATNAAAGAATAAAWAPAAAMVSAATFGANAGPAAAGLAMVSGVASLLSAVPGFREGGFTGSGGTGDVAGFVHGREYVFDAETVQRLGVPFLDALRAGRQPGYKSGGLVGGKSTSSLRMPASRAPSGDGLKVVIEDHVGADIKVERVGPNEVRIIARQEAEKVLADNVGDAVATELAQPNSKTNKALARHTDVRPKR